MAAEVALMFGGFVFSFFDDCFVSVERADLAARYVNGDWSEIDRILPLIDRFIRAGGSFVFRIGIRGDVALYSLCLG